LTIFFFARGFAPVAVTEGSILRKKRRIGALAAWFKLRLPVGERKQQIQRAAPNRTTDLSMPDMLEFGEGLIGGSSYFVNFFRLCFTE